MMKKVKQGSAAALTAALVISALVIPKAHAAIAVEPSRMCSVEINVPSTGFSELENLPIHVQLYKVAEIDVTGAYTALAGFETLDLADIDADTTAAEWQETATLAKTAVEAAKVTEAADVVLKNGNALIENLATGLYLVDTQQALSEYYQYDFAPYLVSLPNNYYYATGDDTWVYDLVGENAVGLKPEKTDRYGNLIIEKVLDVYNATNGGATFVFQIEGTKTDVDTQQVKKVYSDVVSMTFDSTGSDKIKIEGIPAGSDITVTEIYSGASYQVTSDASQKVTIVAKSASGEPSKVTFENTYDERHNGGNGVVNSFLYNSEDGSWTHSAAEDSTP